MSDQPPLETFGADAETIDVRVDEPVDGTVTIVLDRPDARNALNETMRAELIAALERVEDGDDVRALVLRGSSDGGAFCAGADVTEFADRDGNGHLEASEQPRVYETVESLSLPVIAAVNGHAFGGGCELAIACDVRIVRESALLGFPEVTLGIIPGGGGTQRLARLVGRGTAKKLILTGEFVDGEEAVRIGLAEEVHGEGDFADRIAAIAARIAENAPRAVRAAKRAVDAGFEQPLSAGLEYERQVVARLFDTADKDEGVAAFLEDRDPDWSGH